MTGYELSAHALHDLRDIAAYLSDEWGEGFAATTEDGLFKAFERLAETPGLGHRRPDLTTRLHLFYFVDPYFVVYARAASSLTILAVLHSSRNIQRVLRTRLRR